MRLPRDIAAAIKDFGEDDAAKIFMVDRRTVQRWIAGTAEPSGVYEALAHALCRAIKSHGATYIRSEANEIRLMEGSLAAVCWIAGQAKEKSHDDDTERP